MKIKNYTPRANKMWTIELYAAFGNLVHVTHSIKFFVYDEISAQGWNFLCVILSYAVSFSD